jgi:hypothetical protein
MCNSVRYLDREYRSPAQLAELVGGVNHVVWSDNRSHDMNGCLCSIDLEATLQQAGFHWKRGADPMEWIALKTG